MIRLIAALFVLIGAAAQAQSLPERYMVQDVAADDVLNIRAEPTASSEKIGAFGPFTLNVEVLRQQDGWGMVGTGEGNGWVSMRYLAPNPTPEGELPRPMICHGTEPFWTLSFLPRGTEYDALGEGPRPLTTIREAVAYNGYLLEMQESETVQRTFMITPLNCNDGMSDREFGMSVTMFSHDTAGNEVQSGCCTLQMN